MLLGLVPVSGPLCYASMLCSDPETGQTAPPPVLDASLNFSLCPSFIFESPLCRRALLEKYSRTFCGDVRQPSGVRTQRSPFPEARYRAMSLLLAETGGALKPRGGRP